MTISRSPRTVGALRLLAGDPPPAPVRSGGRVIRWPGAPVAGGPDGTQPQRVRRLVVVATSPSWLRRAASSPLAWVSTRRATLVVAAWAPPRPGWSGRLGPLPGLLEQVVRLPGPAGGRVEITVVLSRPQPLHLIIGAALAVLTPYSGLPAPLSADAAAYGPLPGWLPARSNLAAVVGPNPDEKIIRPYDVLLTEPDATAAGAGALRVRADGTGVWLPADAAGVEAADGPTILVDAATANPRGFLLPEPGPSRDAVLRTDDGRWSIESPDAPLCGGSLAVSHVDERSMAALRRLRTLRCELAGGGGLAEAALLAQLAMTGVVLVGGLPRAVADRLAPQLVAVLAEPPPADLAPPIEWEIRSVRQRRAALRQHATGLALPALLGAVASALQVPSVSALLLTKRPETLARALAALQTQTYPELELVVGVPAAARDPAVDRMLARCARPVQVVDVAVDCPVDQALSELTAHCAGTLLTTVDDQDRYGPEHVWDLVLGRYYAGATVVGKAAEFVHLGQTGVTVRRPGLSSEAFATSVAAATMLISRADLDSAGGWRSRTGAAEPGLLGRIDLDGGLTYRTHPLGYIACRVGDAGDPGPDEGADADAPQWTGLPPYAEFGTT